MRNFCEIEKFEIEKFKMEEIEIVDYDDYESL